MKITTKEVILKFKKTHGGLYDYSRVRYKKMKEKVEIVCIVHGSFFQTPDHHLRGTRCPQCVIAANGKRLKASAAKKFVAKARKKHGNKYDYSKVNYDGHKLKVEIVCPVHGSFWQEPSNHLYGFSCKACGRLKTEISRKLQPNEFFKRCAKAHNSYYAYPNKSYSNPESKIDVICPKHGAFKIKARNHLWIKQGCAQCYEETQGLNKRISWGTFIAAAKKVHGDIYTYNRKSYTMMSEPVKIVCKYHGSFTQRGHRHLAGQGCPICARQSQRGRWHSSLLPKEYQNQPSNFYYLRLTIDNEVFYKVGISNDMSRRITTLKRESRCAVKIIYVVAANLITAMQLEEHIQRNFKELIYKPSFYFAGYTECYSLDILLLDNDSF